MMGNKTLSIRTSQNGIQQGSVISCTLALFVLNSIFKEIKLPIKSIIKIYYTMMTLSVSLLIKIYELFNTACRICWIK